MTIKVEILPLVFGATLELISTHIQQQNTFLTWTMCEFSPKTTPLLTRLLKKIALLHLNMKGFLEKQIVGENLVNR